MDQFTRNNESGQLRHAVLRRLPCILLFLITVSLAGCGQSASESSTGAGPIVISVGVYEDGEGFMDWEEMLKYNTSSTGTLRSECRLHGSFTRPGSGRSVTLDLVLTIDDADQYHVNGQYAADGPFHLVLLGAGEGDVTDVTLRLEPGKGEVNHTGPAPLVYESK